MSWLDHHSKSEVLASEAELAAKQGRREDALRLYRAAAEEEARALTFVDKSKAKTLGLTAISAASLWYKANEHQLAEQIAHQSLGEAGFPSFAIKQLKTILQSIWSEQLRSSSGVEFTKGEVLVSVSGGEVVYGGAPLDLILSKVKEVRGIFYRTIELLMHKPFRRRGEPSFEIQEQCRPWLFMAPANSYQFAVRIEKPKQMEMFPEWKPEIEDVTQKFIEIVRASTSESLDKLKQEVPDPEYRSTFLKMTRNLAPTGKAYGKMEIKAADELMLPSVILVPDSRTAINQTIKTLKPRVEATDDQKIEQVLGVLRNIHLDQDWFEIMLLEGERETFKVRETGEIIDDVIGPMVNRKVIVDYVKKAGRNIYRDIQLDE